MGIDLNGIQALTTKIAQRGLRIDDGPAVVAALRFFQGLLDESEQKLVTAAANLEGLAGEVNRARADAAAVREELATCRTALDKTAIERDGVARWQPIESAPKDGMEILTCSQQGMRVAYWYSDDHGRGWYTRGSKFSERTQPTHWMPLPLPPKETT